MVTRIFNITNIKTILNHQNKSGNKKKLNQNSFVTLKAFRQNPIQERKLIIFTSVKV